MGAVATDFYPIAQFALTVVQQPHMVKFNSPRISRNACPRGSGRCGLIPSLDWTEAAAMAVIREPQQFSSS